MNSVEHIHWLSRQAQVQAIFDHIDATVDNIIATAVIIQQIPGPTFHETVRANHVLSHFGACGLQDCGIDVMQNAYGCLPGTDATQKALLIAAHTDTVFPESTDLSVHNEGTERIYGPGLGDNSLGVASVITIAALCQHFNIQPKRNIWFLANSREEGLGDLGGIRAFYDSHGECLHSALILEGMALGQIVHGGIAIRRLRIHSSAEGGHSWYHYGKPSAIHSLLKLSSRLLDLKPSLHPRTTFNIGIIEGGQSVNSIASEASITIDMRSETPEALKVFEDEIRALVRSAEQEEGVSYAIDLVGDRPAGSIPADHDLVLAAKTALRSVGVVPALKVGSTDANLLLAKGLPTVTIGVSTGGNAHRTTEYIDTAPIASGIKHLLLLTLAAAGWEPIDY